MFPISKYFGVFPFYVLKNKLIPLKYYMLVLIILLGISIPSVTYVSKDIRTYLQGVDLQRFKQLFISLQQIVSFIPIISIIWIRINTRQFTKMLETIVKIENMMQISTATSSNRILTVYCVLVPSFRVFLIIYRCVIIPSHYCNHSVLEVSMITLNIIQKYLVIIQFIYLSNILKYLFKLLSLTLSKNNAVEWTKCHEALVINCRILSRCYSPQLLFFIGGTFVTAILDIYVDIMSSIQRADLMHNIISILRNILGIATVWYIIYICTGTAEEAKKFDKTLCQLTINDTTGTLLKNKKIILHFKANQKVEFSVLIFFNLDYTFLCTMIYTATTYIVILVQFS
ncbi:Gustatory receptor 91b [Halyomorpha halys]|nr:Gustatory receptor 91b [Halyomorpha halys]